MDQSSESANLDKIGANSPKSLPFLIQQAIKAALEARWQDAISLNIEILNTDPRNIDALNRIARSYFEMGDLSKAEDNYKQALEVDSYNPIAQKNLKIVQAFKKTGVKHDTNGNGPMIAISPSLFLHEPGKTKIVSLLKVAEPQKLSLAYCGMPVELSIKSRGISILDSQGRYLGVLPDDVSFQLLRLMKGGNKYFACVKSVKVNALAVLIREIFRSKKFKNQPSFLDTPTKRSNEIVNFNRNSDTQINDDAPESEETPAV